MRVNIVAFENSINPQGVVGVITRIPKNKKGKIGIVIAIVTESERGKNRLEKDFLVALQTLLEKNELETKFNIIQYPEKIAAKIKDRESAEKYLRVSKGHNIFYGSITERNVNGENTFVLRLRGLVLHSILNDEAQKQLTDDLSMSLPEKFQFSEKDEIPGFDITSEMVAYATKFIVGCAAMVSGDLLLAYKLLSGIKVELDYCSEERNRSNPILSEIYKRNNSRLLRVAQQILDIQYAKYAFTRDRTILLDSEEYFKKIEEIDPDSYYAKLGFSMMYFCRDDINRAIESLKNCEGGKDSLWRYNLGFLYAWKGDIENALAQYKKAFHGEIDQRVINDLEIFMSEEINAGRGDIRVLTFFRGILNYRLREDYKLAKEDFELFLQISSLEEHSDLNALAKKYLEGIEISGKASVL